MDDDARYRTIVCVRCGRAWPLDAAGGLCPVCLLSTGVADSVLPTVSSADPAIPRARCPTGFTTVTFGAITASAVSSAGAAWARLRSGTVATADGWRSRSSAAGCETPEDRARFLREGQLAGLRQPSPTVYIFGSEEIDGIPVISMELLTGRTLKDRVAAEGPLAPSEAV